MRDEVEPLSHLGMAVRGPLGREKFLKPLQEKVKAQKLWACHLGPELGGQGYGQVKLGLMNEKLGRNGLAPTIFGCQAPDSGNAEIIAHYGTDAQKEKYLWPLLNGDIRSAFRCPSPPADRTPDLQTRAVRGRRRMVDQRREVVSPQRTLLDRAGALCGDDPDARTLSAHVDLPGAHRHPWGGDVRKWRSGAAARSAAGPRLRPLHKCEPALRRPVGERAQPSSSPRCALAAGGSPRHAHGRGLQERARTDVPAGGPPHDRDGKRPTCDGPGRIADSWIALESFRLMVLRTAG